jgi:hypothetical protein
MDNDALRQADMIQRNLAHVRKRIAEAAARAGRSPQQIDILAVTKGQPASILRAAYLAGLRKFGENYAQEALTKQEALADLAGIEWHFIGHLQSNKASLAARRFALIQGVDGKRLAMRLDEASRRSEIVQNILVQANLGDEATKSGASLDEVPALCEEIADLPNLRLLGLMGIAPLADDGATTDPSPYFARLRELFEGLPRPNRQILSMGMSGDFEAAIAQGATMVRVGSALLGPRQPR